MSRGFRSPFPTYNVLDKWDTPSWNDQTRAVVRKRLEEVPPRRFFDETEWEMLGAICDRLIPQPDRPNDPVPIVPFIDEKLHDNRGDGYRIGYATSRDGLRWQRDDASAGIDVADSGWDSEELAYPSVFRHDGRMHMLYSGNGFGREGFGIAVGAAS